MTGTPSPHHTLRCRFYPQPWPSEGEVVIATVTEVKDTMSYVTLPEYGGQEAMLPHSQLSNRRLRSVRRHVQKDQMMCLRVTRVDPSKGYVDVSKRQVEEADRLACERRYRRGKTIHSIIGRLAELLDVTSPQEMEDLHHRIPWRLDTLYNTQTAAYDIFQQAYSIPDVLNDLDLDSETLGLLTEIIRHRFALGQVKVCGEVEVTCFGKEGVDAVKHALKAGKMAATSVLPVEICLLATPFYSVTCQALTNQRAEALASVQMALRTIETTIGQYTDGRCNIRKQPSLDSEVPALEMCS